mmetsp:Transcript_32255/g.37328  ORF Transcript_32255/g.37328 Transcript_32255/m.37328 type:complete len:465 (+) Transcript_32255:51-1445(+)
MIPTLTGVAKPPPGNRSCDITVFGCTGNAGRAVAYQVLRTAAQTKSPKATPIRIGLAGRNRDKMESILKGIRAELSHATPSLSIKDENVSIMIADASDAESMLTMAQSSRVVISCAGPYSRYGEAAVVACIAGKAHYVDIAGEIPWVSRMISEHDNDARRAGVCLLPLSGYDCVPSELGMVLAGSALEEFGGGGEVKMEGLELVYRNKGGAFPRGTLYTVLDGVEGNTPSRKEGDPRFYPREYRSLAAEVTSPRTLIPQWSDALGVYTGPNFMAGINAPVLCRAAPTLGFDQLKRYSDRIAVAGVRNGRGWIPAQLYATALVVGGCAILLAPVRWWLRKKLATYSYGGDADGNVCLTATAVCGTSGTNHASSNVKCHYPGDAGIYATGLFATAVANTLLEATVDNSQVPPPAGFHTPVAALHHSGGSRPLVEQLQSMGATIHVSVQNTNGEEQLVDAAELRSRL